MTDVARAGRQVSWHRRAGLRRRAVVAFAVGGLLLSTVLALSTYLIARGYLLNQREASGVRQAFADASFVRDGLLTAGASPAQVLGDISPRAGSRVLVRVADQWYSSDLGRTADLPDDLVRAVRTGEPAFAWAEVGGRPALLVGTPLPEVDAEFYEVSVVSELERTFDVLRTVLFAAGGVTAAGAALVGRYVARRVVRPLDEVASAASAIAAGRIDTRLAPTDDPDLVAIVGSFNTMVDALAARIDREARFTADVSHELRSPLTTLVTGVELLAARRDELPPRSQRALDLVRQEVDRLRRTLEDLLELARLDAGADTGDDTRSGTDPVELVRHVLADSGRDTALLDVPGDDGGAGGSGAGGGGGGPAVVLVERRQVERALLNLFENADRYGGGLTRVGVTRDEDSVLVMVDDDGPGVPAEDRERIFARFARGSAARGSTGGTGLGLSLVAETAHRHGGGVWCTENPGGGARFVLRLPLVGGADGVHATTGAGAGDAPAAGDPAGVPGGVP